MLIPVYYFIGLSLLWMLPFILFRPGQKGKLVQAAPNSRWGIVLQVLGNCLLLLPARTIWLEPIPLWRLCGGIAAGLIGIVLATAGIRHLGKQWRIQAALSEGHELITSGPYKLIRHPIYASMLAMYLASVFLLGRLPWWPIGCVVFFAGIQIRVHIEDALLRNHFGSRFEEWSKAVPALLPGLH